MKEDRETVRFSALNVGLAAHRLGTQTRGIAPLANAIRQTSSECGQMINGMTEILAKVLTQAEAIDQQALESAFDSVEVVADIQTSR